MKVELSHVDDEGHYLPLCAQETIEVEKLFLSKLFLVGVEVREPESHSLDVSMKMGEVEVRWSGLYHPERVVIGIPVKKGDRLKFRIKNIGSSAMLVRLDLHLEERMRL